MGTLTPPESIITYINFWNLAPIVDSFVVEE